MLYHSYSTVCSCSFLFSHSFQVTLSDNISISQWGLCSSSFLMIIVQNRLTALRVGG